MKLRDVMALRSQEPSGGSGKETYWLWLNMRVMFPELEELIVSVSTTGYTELTNDKGLDAPAPSSGPCDESSRQIKPLKDDIV